MPGFDEASIRRVVAMQTFARLIGNIAEAQPKSRSRFAKLKRFRVFDQHYNAGAYTRMTLWDFWPLEFAIYNVLRADHSKAPEGYTLEHYRYQPLHHLFNMLSEIRWRDPDLFEAYVIDIAGKLDGTSGSLSAVATELFLQTNVTWEPALIARRETSKDKALADIRLIGSAFEARVEAKNIESQDGFSFHQHLYFARGIDASIDLLSPLINGSRSTLIKIAKPEKILVDDKGLRFRRELAMALSELPKSAEAITVCEELSLPLTLSDVLKKHARSSSKQHNYKMVAHQDTGVGVVFALPFVGKGLEYKVRELCRNAVKKQTGEYKAVICLVYDFASIASIRRPEDLDRWKDGVDVLHREMLSAALTRSSTFRERCNSFIGFALVPPVPHLGDRPLLQFFEQLLDGTAHQITANLVGSRGQLIEHIEQKAYDAHYEGLFAQYSKEQPDDKNGS